MINGITFSDQVMTSADFAHFLNTLLESNGITKGCDISTSDGLIYIKSGYFIVHGRMVRINGTEVIETPEVQSGQLYCLLVFEIDLSKSNTVDSFLQGYFKTLTSSTGYPDMTQEDLDAGGTVYQMPWVSYVKSINGVEDFKDQRTVYSNESIWKKISDQNEEYKEEFDTYFASQKTTIEQMIIDLEDEGYASQTEMNELVAEVTETKKSVSDGKGLIAAAITLKNIATAATDTFAQMAENIGRIVLGSGNAAKADVLAGKTFTNDDGVEYTGTMVDKSGTTQSATASLDTTNSRLQMTIPATGKYSTTSKIYVAYSTIRSLIGLTAAKIATGNTILGLAGTYKGLGDAVAANVLSGKKFSTASLSNASGTMTNNGAISKTITPSASAQSYTIPAGYHNGSGKVNVGAIPNPVWTGWKRLCSLTAQSVNYNNPEISQTYDLGAEFAKYNTFIFRVVYGTNSSNSTPSRLYQDTFICTEKADDISSHTITPTNTRNSSDTSEVSSVIYDVSILSDCRNVEIFITYDGDSETAIRYGWFEVVLIAALSL